LFLKIISNPQHFTQDRKFSTWVYSVANNMCKNEYRREAFRKSVNHSEIHRVLSLSITPDVDNEELKEVLGNALKRLDEDERNLYALRYEVELPLEEIAELLGCPVGTVKSKLFYLKKKLAGHLTGELPEKLKYGIQ
jgi:RNA polymerase sigma-70 factor, ECF subfamily